MITVKLEGVEKTIQSLRNYIGPEAIARKLRAGMRASKAEVKQALGREMRKAFKVKKPQFADRTWRISTANSQMEIRSLVKWLGAQGGSRIFPKGHRALLIPINTYLGTRITTKKFYKIIDWLYREKLLVFKNGIAYAKPIWNESRRGGVAAGSRINQKFRSKFQGTLKRPSGFSLADIKVIDGDRLVPIAVVRRSIKMPKRFLLEDVARRHLLQIVTRHIQKEFAK